MKRSSSSFIWLLVAFTFFFISIQVRKKTEQLQLGNDLILKSEGKQTLSPELNLAISLGVFRSVLIDFLWLRAAKLQKENHFYEIVQIYDMIGKLQPHNGKIWAYSAWNMAYNISVKLPPGIERWRWVQNGIDRIKKNGLKYNPNNGLLYKELAWIYAHKIARKSDDSHLFYKTKLAESVTECFLSFPMNATQLLSKLKSKNSIEQLKANTVKNNLFQNLHMDLNFMAELEKDPYLGPLDWRLAEVHAIYWAKLALKKKVYGVSKMEFNRICYQSMQYLLRQGTLIYFEKTKKAPATISLWPDYKQAKAIHAMFLNQFNNPNSSDISPGLQTAYHYFLKEALEILSFAGQDEDAEILFRLAKKIDSNILRGSTAKENVQLEMLTRLKSMNSEQSTALIGTLLMRHFWWKAHGNIKKSKAMIIYAKKLWLNNLKVNPHGERRVSQSFQNIKKSTLKTIFSEEMFPLILLEKLRES